MRTATNRCLPHTGPVLLLSSPLSPRPQVPFLGLNLLADTKVAITRGKGATLGLSLDKEGCRGSSKRLPRKSTFSLPNPYPPKVNCRGQLPGCSAHSP